MCPSGPGRPGAKVKDMSKQEEPKKDKRSLKLPKGVGKGPGGRKGLPPTRPLRTLTLWIALTLITILVIQFYFKIYPFIFFFLFFILLIPFFLSLRSSCGPIKFIRCNILPYVYTLCDGTY